MKLKNTIFFLDYQELHKQYHSAAIGQSVPDTPLYTVYYGLNDASGLPAWFVANGTHTTTIKSFDFLKNHIENEEQKKHIRLTAFMLNGGEQNLEHTAITYADIVAKEQFKQDIGEDFLGIFSSFQEEYGILLNHNVPKLLIRENLPLVQLDKKFISAVCPAND